jgi:hypothetical protein
VADAASVGGERLGTIRRRARQVSRGFAARAAAATQEESFGLKHTLELSGGIFEKLLDIGESRVENEFARAEN